MNAIKALWSMATGRSFAWIPGNAKDLAANEFDDVTLGKWARWAVATCQRFYAKEATEERGFMEVMTTQSIIALVLLTLRANATRATFDVGGITYKGEPKGDWKVTIERVGDAP